MAIAAKYNLETSFAVWYVIVPVGIKRKKKGVCSLQKQNNPTDYMKMLSGIYKNPLIKPCCFCGGPLFSYSNLKLYRVLMLMADFAFSSFTVT